ncbi:DUF2635 domain-containing protein [Aeromonas piscicola]|uniref:DUF2635 domain-containing protein n=1 Tax=Aeromonas piscicola TaxID=600645 RepID=UPI0005B50B5F|nr:DUF2635 domain-containing protein [Aeromonas piscicola]
MSDVLDELHIKPAPGCQVRDPRTRLPLAAAGEMKPAIGYWLRRLHDGSVVLVDTQPKKKAVAK